MESYSPMHIFSIFIIHYQPLFTAVLVHQVPHSSVHHALLVSKAILVYSDVFVLSHFFLQTAIDFACSFLVLPVP